MKNIEENKSTKQKIFEASALLFSKYGYDGVSMREIAREVGIKESSIYNHYKNKEEILKSLFDYLTETLTNYRPSDEEIEKLLEYMSVEDVFKQLLISLGKTLDGTLANIVRVVYTEQFRNTQAKKIMLENIIAEPAAFVKRVMKIMNEKGLIRNADFELAADEYNYTLISLTFEYAHALNNGEDPSPVIKKIFRHVSFICGYLKAD